MSFCKMLPVSGLILSLLAVPASALQVVASVKPLQLLSAALLEGVAEPGLLVQPDASVHHYALKPSDMRRLVGADLVVWVGPELELFLAKALDKTDARILQLMPDALPDASAKEHGSDHEEHAANRDAEESESGHLHALDAHLWMDPQLMLSAARRMQQMLAEIAPEHAQVLAANYSRFAAALQVADEALAVRLAPVAGKGFFVFHDAYGHFVDHYGLNQLGYFTVDPARPPGARHLSDIRQQLEQREAVCVFSEPQFRSAIVSTVTAGTAVRHAELDPLARDIKLGPNGYIDYLNSLGDAFVGCLSAN